MKKPIDPNLERFEDSVFSLTGGDDTPGVSYRAPQFEMKETSAAATPGEYHASENHRQRAEATGAPVEPAPGGEEHHHHHEHTLLAYEQVASQFTPNEQEVIQRFLTALVGEIK